VSGAGIHVWARSIFVQPTRKEALAQHQRVVDELEERFPTAAAMLDEVAEEILEFSLFTEGVWWQIWGRTTRRKG